MKASKGIKSFFQEFRKFIEKGNVIGLAVGVIIGGAFQTIVKSLIDDVIMPIVSLVTGGVDYSNWFIALNGEHYATLEEAKAAGAATLSFGSFLTSVINFLFMALVIFILVKIINSIMDKTRTKNEEAPTTKDCPYCKTEIALEAVRCPHCTSTLEGGEVPA